MKTLQHLLPGSVLALSLALAPVAYAQEVINDRLELRFSGNILAAPCTVDLPGGDDGEILVEFDTVTPTDLENAGMAGEWKNFSLLLKDCGATTTKYKATFSGNPASTDPNKYLNTGTAKHVEIELAADDGSNTSLGNSTVYTGPVFPATQSGELKMKARPYTVTGGVTSGTIAGLVQVTFTYD